MANAWWMQTQRVTTAAIEAAERFAAKEAALDALIAAGPGGGVNYIHQATVERTNAQVLALPAAGVTLVADPGAGVALFYLGGFIHGDFTAGQYGDVDANAQILIGHSDENAFVSVTGVPTGFLNNAAARVLLLPACGPVGAGGYAGSVVSASPAPVGLGFKLFTYNGTNFNGGNDANVFRVTMSYLRADLTTGLLVAA